MEFKENSTTNLQLTSNFNSHMCKKASTDKHAEFSYGRICAPSKGLYKVAVGIHGSAANKTIDK